MTDENKASTEQANEANADSYTNEFGAALKEAREKADMTVEEAAKRLHISREIIVALENSKAIDLPSATFTIGYIRSYARMLSISADDIIASYNQLIPATVVQMSPSPFVPAEIRESNNTVAVIMIIAIVCLLLLAWWFQSGSLSSSDKAHFLKDMPGFNSTNNTQDSTTYENDELLLPDASSSDNETIEILDELEKASGFEVPTAEKKTTELADNSSEKMDELILFASGESWCEVFDADGQRLFYQLLKQGNEQKIVGKSPFKIFLGDASQVRIETNKKIVNFDHLINANKNTANFTISSDAIAISNTR